MKNFIEVTIKKEKRLINTAHIIEIRNDRGQAVIFHTQISERIKTKLDETYEQVLDILKD